MKSKRITFKELCDIMFDHNTNKKGCPLKAVIVFTQESFNKEYSELSRSYSVSSESKYFMPNMGGNSLFGNCLDGSESGVRLDWYIYGDKPWRVEYCYLVNDWKFKTREELIAEAKAAGEAFADCLEAIALSDGVNDVRDGISNGIEMLFQYYAGGTQKA